MNPKRGSFKGSRLLVILKSFQTTSGSNCKNQEGSQKWNAKHGNLHVENPDYIPLLLLFFFNFFNISITIIFSNFE